MARAHDQLGLDGRDVGGGVLDHAIVALLDRPVPFDRDDGVDLDGRDDGDRLQTQDEGVPGDMLSTAVGTNPTFAAPGFRLISPATPVRAKGRVKSCRVRLARTRRPAT